MTINYCHVNPQRLKQLKFKPRDSGEEEDDDMIFIVRVYDEDGGSFVDYYFDNHISLYIFMDSLDEAEVEYDLIDEDGYIIEEGDDEDFVDDTLLD